jgi:hypothetical protein
MAEPGRIRFPKDMLEGQPLLIVRNVPTNVGYRITNTGEVAFTAVDNAEQHYGISPGCSTDIYIGGAFPRNTGMIKITDNGHDKGAHGTFERI